MSIAKLRYWLARRIRRRYAREYLHDVDRMGLAWTLALIDEDVELHGARRRGWRHRLRGALDRFGATNMITLCQSYRRRRELSKGQPGK